MSRLPAVSLSEKAGSKEVALFSSTFHAAGIPLDFTFQRLILGDIVPAATSGNLSPPAPNRA